MLAFAWLLIIAYATCLILFCLHVVDKLLLTVSFLRHRRGDLKRALPVSAEDYTPSVTVQLPVYNEKYVVEEVIDAAARLSYPSGRLSIQVIDDSNDETIELARAKVREYQALGVNIDQIAHPVGAIKPAD